MRQLLFAFIFLFSISIVSCSESGTGPNPSNDGSTTYSVAVEIAPSDAGTISPSAQDTYEEGKEIELQANTNEGYVFKYWTGDIDTTTDNPLSLTVDQDYEITANFEIKSYELTINTEGGGTVSERILQQKSDEYNHGTIVELTAEPHTGFEFVEWQGDLSGAENPTQITVDNPKEVTAVFEVATYPISVDVSGEGSVTVTPDQEEYEYRTEVELLAEPNNSDWEFESWDGDTTSTDNPITISVDSSITVTGKFANTLFAGGAGTETNPYQISTVDQLQAINEYPEAHYVQINDIDASETQNWNGGEGFKPIGDEVIPFSGSYNGQNYSIINLMINRNTEYVGLFGYGEEASFNKLILSNIDIKGHTNTYDVGGLVGNCMNGCELITINISGKVTNNSSNNSSVGGIFGFISSNIDNTDNTPNQISDLSANVNLDVQNTSNTGGLGGTFTDGTIEDSKSLGIINSIGLAGGLIGGVNRATIHNTSSTVEVNSSISGGLIGSLEGSIENSYSTGDVRGEDSVGGLVGRMDTRHSDGIELFINNSYSSGTIEGKKFVGGIVGGWHDNERRENKSTITDSYSEGNISGTERVGGIAGYLISINVSNAYSEGTVRGDLFVGGIAGRNAQGNLISSKSLGKVIGDQHVGGLIGFGYGSIFRSFSSADIEGINIVGGLAGEYSGNIEKSYSSGSIVGTENKIGGLVGVFRYDLSHSIIESYSLSTVSGSEEVGGIVGDNNGAKINNAYAHGNVEGDISVGGLVGVNRNEGKVTNSYAKGSITGNTDTGGLVGINGATIESSYWDTESSNQSNAVGRGSSDGTTGLTTSEMTSTSAQDNMPDFDWSEIWVTNEDYPALFWE
jgi:hypothetical protein